MNDPAVIGMYMNGLSQQTSGDVYPLSSSGNTLPNTVSPKYDGAASLTSLLSFAPGNTNSNGNSATNGSMFRMGSFQDQQQQQQQQQQIPVHNLLGLNFNPNSTLPVSDDLIDRAASAPLVKRYTIQS